MLLRSETAEIQSNLGNYCRTGVLTHLPGANPKRLKEYRRLVRNIMHDAMTQAYPITREVLEEQEWQELVDAFIRDHNCQSPEIWKLPKEFYMYVRDADHPTTLRYPFLTDLLYFEWIEIEVYTMPDEDVECTSSGDYLTDPLALNPERRLIRLTYPVHLHPARDSIKFQGNYFVLVYRHPGTSEVRFTNISMLHAWILERMEQENIPLQDLAEEASSLFAVQDTDALKNHLCLFFRDLKKEGAVSGFKII